MAGISQLAGKTVFITGASRGIGKAIALRCAEDGANIVIAAKTAEPHPKLPGTIYTAAEEIEKAGGKCLPCLVDIRYEDQVQKAIDEAVSKFGGIDILVNNASAISLTGTAVTSMKQYDLMNSINTRGTYLCSKLCVPHLKKASNPHILNLSPPLNMRPRWFKDHVAYTMAKYGMSMCVLGMAEEFKDDGIAVNALWPRTAIYTAAMEMLGGGAGIKDQCRSPEIIADSAYAMLTKDSKQYTGNFCIDDEVLKAEGVSDMSKYQYQPDAELMPDFFLDEFDNVQHKLQEYSSSDASSGNADLDKTFQRIKALLGPELVKSVGGVFQFEFKDGGDYFLDLKNDSGSMGPGKAAGESDVTMVLKAEDFVSMAEGKINPTTAFMTGKLKIKGNLGMATKLEKVLKQAQSSKL